MHPSVHFIELLWLESAQKFCLAGGSTCSALYQPSTCSAIPWLNHINSVNGVTKKVIHSSLVDLKLYGII